jgi:hypothetical protein
MKKLVLPAIAAALAVANTRATPLDDVAVAAQRLADAANYSWASNEKTLRGPITMATSVKGATERDGFTVAKKTMNNPRGSDYVEDTVYWGTQVAYLRNGSWKTEQELRAAAGGRSGVTVVGNGIGKSGRAVGVMTATSQNDAPPSASRPAQMILWILAQVKNVTVSGDAFIVDLSYDYIARVMRGNGRNGPLVVSPNSTGSAKFWINGGVIAKYQIQIKASYENSDAPAAERTTTVEIKNVGSTDVAVSAEARAKFQL